MNNSIKVIKTLMENMNPQSIVMNMIKNNTNPVLNNLIDLASKGDTKGVEDFARNIMKEKGIDYDKQFSEFMNNFK